MRHVGAPPPTPVKPKGAAAEHTSVHLSTRGALDKEGACRFLLSFEGQNAILCIIIVLYVMKNYQLFGLRLIIPRLVLMRCTLEFISPGMR